MARKLTLTSYLGFSNKSRDTRPQRQRDQSQGQHGPIEKTRNLQMSGEEVTIEAQFWLGGYVRSVPLTSSSIPNVTRTKYPKDLLRGSEGTDLITSTRILNLKTGILTKNKNGQL